MDQSAVPRREILGLSGDLWRLAIVVGIAQFSMSIWGWRFGIFMQENLVTLDGTLQMGFTYAAGTLAALIGFNSSGLISDLIGRKRTMQLGFLPMILGLGMLSFMPVWPWIPLAYASVNLGWSFILIISRAVPADVIASRGGSNAPRKFMMVIMPAFLVDGLSPLTAGFLISNGLDRYMLMLIGAFGACFALVCTGLFIHESLGAEVRKTARTGSKIVLRGLGGDFWKLVVAMMPFYFAYNLAIGYQGNLVVTEWGITDVQFAQAWTAYALTSVALMYSASSLVNRSRKGALIAVVLGNSLIFYMLSAGYGLYMMIAVNMMWAVPIVLWTGGERSLVVLGVSKERQGRALGTFQFLMSSTGLVAPSLGQFIWNTTGSLRSLFAVAATVALMLSIPVALILRTIKVPASHLANPVEASNSTQVTD